MAKYKLVIDPGHEGDLKGLDPGAVSTYGKEADYTLQISLYQYKRFKELGVSVGITRNSSVSLTEDQRVAKAKEGEYCLSNHLNAGGGDRGEVIHSIYDDGKLANKIKDALQAAGQTAVKVYCREYKGTDYYYMHRRTGATKTNIVEYCFIDTKADFQHFKAHMYEYAEAVVKAFCSFTGHPYKAPAASTSKPATSKKPAAITTKTVTLNSTASQELEVGRDQLRKIIAGAYKEGVFLSDHTAKVATYTDDELVSYAIVYLVRKGAK